MAEVTVTCGCGRKMVQRGTDRRGVYRCGCGAQVTVEVPPAKPSCIGLAPTGERCRLLPLRDSAQWGMPLCKEHLGGYYEVLDLIKQGERAWESIQFQMVSQNKELAEREADAEAEALRKAYAEQSVVYYARMRDTIKIGYTGNLRARISSLVIDEVLATEPGGQDLEKMRHRQFAALKIRGERFRPEPELISHIEMIRKHFGDPVITGYIYRPGIRRPVWGGATPKPQSAAD